MAITANTHHTLNDYRLSAESTYESGSSSKVGAAALVIAIFLGIGAYFYYSTSHVDTNPAAAQPSSTEPMNSQAPAATEGATPADTMDNAAMPDAPGVATGPATPSTGMNSTSAPAQPQVMDRVPESKPAPAAAQSALRTKPASKSPTKSAREATAPATDNTATATPDMATSAPVAPEQPVAAGHSTDTAEFPIATKSEVPAEVAPDAGIDRSAGG